MEKLEEIGEGGESGAGKSNKSSDGLIDRSKVRILLCDNDRKSSEEALRLLCKCSYQVTSVRSPRQVIDALNAEGPEIDIILAEVDLPMAKGMKMLKYITRDKELRRIPVIMMSAQDEISVVVKCLRLGAADYLVKPLRTNELLNLWTHMWRRRRMLGLSEKNILNCDFDLVASDPSDPNTNSTTLFSDDTDDKSKKNSNLEIGISRHQEDESIAGEDVAPPDCQPEVPGIIDCKTGQYSLGPKKSEFKIGESSAFFTYVKSSRIRNSSLQLPLIDESAYPKIRTEENVQAWTKEIANPITGNKLNKNQNSSCQAHVLDDNATQKERMAENIQVWGEEIGKTRHEYENELLENYNRDDLPCNSNAPKSCSVERSCTPHVVLEFPQQMNSKEMEPSKTFTYPGNEPQSDISGFPRHSAYPYSIPGMVNQATMPSPSQMYQNHLQDMPNNASPAMLQQYSQLPQCHQVVGMASLPYYPFGLCLQPGQMPSSHPWPSIGGSPSNEVKLGKVDRREAALIKFRQKRKERCFDKKIRYVNRKRLAERRPRVRGQFVRKVNGVNVDLNGEPTVDYNEDEEEEDEDGASSFPEDDGSGCQ